MKHPKDRGTRQRANYQHKALRQSGLFKQRVEEDKRRKALDKLAEDYDEEDYFGQHQPETLPEG